MNRNKILAFKNYISTLTAGKNFPTRLYNSFIHWAYVAPMCNFLLVGFSFAPTSKEMPLVGNRNDTQQPVKKGKEKLVLTEGIL